MMIQPTQLYGFVVVAGLLMSMNPCNLRLMNYLHACKALYICRDTSTGIEDSLQIRLFMQNKANFQKVKFNVTKVLTTDYDQIDTWSIRKTKPIQSQLKPIKANIMPKQTQYKPNQTQFHQEVSPLGLPPHLNIKVAFNLAGRGFLKFVYSYFQML